MSWLTRERSGGGEFVDPISGEFFADASIRNPATGLVNEALQNALDAGRHVSRPDKEPVRVRFTYREGERALPPSVAERWFGELKPHLTRKAGIRNAPDFSEPCPCLLIEDFGTCGLTGDPRSDSVEDPGNHFKYFVRSDGRTGKNAGDQGSWGVGKTVFPLASRINGYLALTVRHDDGQPLLIGKVQLKNRNIGGTDYEPPCYFAESWGDRPPQPFTDDGRIAELRKDFGVTRDGEPGLSIVVPWVDEDVSYDDLRKAVIDKFAYAILRGSLTVTLDGGGEILTLDAESLMKQAERLLPGRAGDLALMAWSCGVAARDHLDLEAPAAGEKQKWAEDLVPEAVRSEILQKLNDRERVAVRVPLHVPEADSQEVVAAEFFLYFEHHEDARQIRPEFIRERLSLRNVNRAVPVSRIRPLVVIPKGPLADLLRAAEPPNHTDWDQKTANFLTTHRGGNHVITFVKECTKRLLGIVRSAERDPDPNVTIDFFHLPEPEAKPAKKPKQKKPEEHDDGDGDPADADPPASRERIRIDAVEDGFVLKPGAAEAAGADRWSRINVRVAYDVLQGSPWKQYEPDDFDFQNKASGIEFATSLGVEREAIAPNRLRFTLPELGDFEIYVTGFGTDRDLHVSCTEAGAATGAGGDDDT